ncbi:hypothetical protein WS48_32725 [Burkholderia sp. RF7-non_BP1]|nr:hypothetical protein WS45_25740 [Burkholderia sp. RF2-non_BP3]KUY85235.1 hypothetical protein WS46_06010 [Burkholderia sp. RF4-BP95]KUZ03795.1 hypothetical protein WS48_32725 [Burkholderia sp. RF7-non_BP1]KUZ05402.1 hypothetical protein WS49_05955 [Burkholderia sp. RF7-non_BP4]
MIVHGDEQILPANAIDRIAPIAGHTMARTRDTAELLDVDVQQVARCLVFVTLNRFTWLQVAQPGQSSTRQHPADGRGRHAHLSGDLKYELVYHQRFATHEQTWHSISEYIEIFYSRQRTQTRLNYQAPVAFTQHFYLNQIAA